MTTQKPPDLSLEDVPVYAAAEGPEPLDDRMSHHAKITYLRVGSRHLMIAMFHDLRWVDAGEIEPLGHVLDPTDDSGPEYTAVVGPHIQTGELVRAAPDPAHPQWARLPRVIMDDEEAS